MNMENLFVGKHGVRSITIKNLLSTKKHRMEYCNCNKTSDTFDVYTSETEPFLKDQNECFSLSLAIGEVSKKR